MIHQLVKCESLEVLLRDLGKHIDHLRVDHQENATSRSEPQDLGQIPLVQSSYALLSGNNGQAGPRPFILAPDTFHFGHTLDPRFYHV
jgi:hypothetical protein